MKRKSFFFIALLCLGIFAVMQALPLHAQKTSKPLILLYSNNFNGEVEPCSS